jgi:hypothetical protein
MMSGGYYWKIETKNYFASLECLGVPKSNHLWGKKDKDKDIPKHAKEFKYINICHGVFRTGDKNTWFWIRPGMNPESEGFVYKGDTIKMVRKNKLDKIYGRER